MNVMRGTAFDSYFWWRGSLSCMTSRPTSSGTKTYLTVQHTDCKGYKQSSWCDIWLGEKSLDEYQVECEKVYDHTWPYSCRGSVLVRSRQILLDLGPDQDRIYLFSLDPDWTSLGPHLDRTAVQSRSGPGSGPGPQVKFCKGERAERKLIWQYTHV